MKINKLISEYLIYSYAYYEKSVNLISDSEFDAIMVCLKDNWESVLNSDHPHKHLLDLKAIEGSTGYHLTDCYPTIVKMTSNMLINKSKKIETINDLF